MLASERRQRRTGRYGGATVWHRIGIVALAVVSVILVLLSRAKTQLFDDLRAAVTDAATPVLDALAYPFAKAREWAADAGDIFDVYEENQRLREENARLLRWQQAALTLETKVARYEALLNVKTDPPVSYVTARVIADVGGPFVQAFLINAGENDGAREGQAAVDGGGLIGRVVETGAQSSRVLLIQDMSSHIPVAIGPNEVRAIMSGDNSMLPRIEWLPLNATIAAGDRVVTSGDGGLLPPGLPVGTVTGEAGEFRVVPFSEHDRADFLRLLQYEFPRELDTPGSEAVAAQPDVPVTP